MNQYEAISYRRTVRKFDFRPISEELIQKLHHFIKELSPWNETCVWKLDIIVNTSGKAAVKGFGTVPAPYYLVFYGGKESDARRNAGYILEQMILYLTTKGLGTCYQGAAQLTEKKKMGSLQALMVVAFGFPVKRLLRDSTTAKRHPLKELCIFKEEIEEEEKAVLYAARLAPSALNLQPWRFVVYKNRIHIFTRKKQFWERQGAYLLEIDLGIVLCHMQLAAEEQWMSTAFAREEKILEMNMKNLDYVTTLSLHVS